MMRVFCLFNRHRPIREDVEWTGLHHQGTCKTCGVLIRRLEGGGWRKRRTKKGLN